MRRPTKWQSLVIAFVVVMMMLMLTGCYDQYRIVRIREADKEGRWFVVIMRNDTAGYNLDPIPLSSREYRGHRYYWYEGAVFWRPTSERVWTRPTHSDVPIKRAPATSRRPVPPGDSNRASTMPR